MTRKVLVQHHLQQHVKSAYRACMLVQLLTTVPLATKKPGLYCARATHLLPYCKALTALNMRSHTECSNKHTILPSIDVPVP